MGAWLRLLLGLDEGEIPAGSVSRLELAGLSGGFWTAAVLLMAVAAVVLVILIYRRETDLGAGKRLTLTALRLLALAAVLLVLLNPRLAVEIQGKRFAQTLLLVDGSGSMSARDRYGPEERAALRHATGLEPAAESLENPHQGPSRSELAAAALASSDLAAKLNRSNRVHAYRFDEAITAEEPPALASAVRSAPRSGRSTWLGSALHAALETARAEPVAAVVLISDGRQNGGQDLTGAAAELEARGIPLHALGVGQVQAQKNIAVTEVNAPEVAETGLPLRIRVRVQASGFPGELEVKLTRLRAGEQAAEPVGAETVPVRGFQGEAVVNFTDVPSRDGRYRYIAEVAPRPGEESQRDNLKSAQVVVAAEKCRVLLVAGGPTFEFRYLRSFFIRDAGIQVSSWLESADPRFPQEGDLPLRTLPGREADLRPYDVVVLLDPDPEVLPAGFGEALERFVADTGGGLCFVAGEHYTQALEGSETGRRLLGLLPVELGEPAPTGDHRRAWRAELTPAGRTHTLCQLKGTADENQRLWEVLPRFYFRFPVSGLKPAALALLGDGESPVAAVHQAGAGRVLFIATDDLWRWREYREGIHEQFWSGAARFLALGKRLAGTRQVAINTDRERYLVGDEVRIEAHVLDAGQEPLAAPRVEAAVERTDPPESAASPAGGGGGDGAGPPPAQPAAEAPARREVPLEAIPARPGWFRGRLKTDAAGSYRVALSGMAAEGTPAAFSVAGPSNEADDPSPDFAALEELARRSGGTFGPLSDIAKVPERIPDRTLIEVLGRKTATVWDSATLLLVFAGALIVEWSLRKKWRLC